MEKLISGKVRDFQCSLCPSSFFHKNNLRRHIQGHVRESTFQCHQCTYKTPNNSCLVTHVKAVHDKQTPLKCTFRGCRYKTAKNDNLQRHCLTHETDPSVRRPFACTFEGCNYRATRKGDLKRHIESQHDENRAKTVVCSMCSAAFYTPEHLRVHIKGVHIKESVYSCSQCEYKSLDRSNMRRHERSIHGDGGMEVIPGKSTRQSANTLRRRQKINPKNGNNPVPSDETVSEPRPSTTKYQMKTAGGRKTEFTGEDSLRNFQCTTCHFTAKNEQEALEHSAFNNGHILLPN